MTHKRIKRFQIEVKFYDNSQLISLRPQYENLLIQDMRGKGYVRVLDIDPAFSIEFDGETWKFLMTLHGIYVGKKKAWQLEGTTQNKLIPRNMPQVTLNQS
jgi:hypothetical protein